MNLNCWNGAGRLTKDAEFSTTKKGTPMSKFRMAVNDRRNDDTLFINILCFGKMAENLQPKLLKGRLVSITGKLKIESKDEMKRRGQRSPDAADAFVLTMAGEAATAAGHHSRWNSRMPIQRDMSWVI